MACTWCRFLVNGCSRLLLYEVFLRDSICELNFSCNNHHMSTSAHSHIREHAHQMYVSVTECIHATHNIELLPLFNSVLHRHSWMGLCVQSILCYILRTFCIHKEDLQLGLVVQADVCDMYTVCGIY